MPRPQSVEDEQDTDDESREATQELGDCNSDSSSSAETSPVQYAPPQRVGPRSRLLQPLRVVLLPTPNAAKQADAPPSLPSPYQASGSGRLTPQTPDVGASTPDDYPLAPVDHMGTVRSYALPSLFPCLMTDIWIGVRETPYCSAGQGRSQHKS